MKKTILTLLTGLLLLLASCHSETNHAANSQKLGTLLLKVNPSLAINYDEMGKVWDVVAKNEDGKAILKNYQQFKDKDIKVVVSELVAQINEAGYFVEEVENSPKKITLELEKGSPIPNQTFLKDIAREVQGYLDKQKLTNKIAIPRNLDDSDYDDLTDYDKNGQSDYQTDNHSDYHDDKDDQSDYHQTNKNRNDDHSDYSDSDYGKEAIPKAQPKVDNTNSDYHHSDYHDDKSDYSDSDYDH